MQREEAIAEFKRLGASVLLCPVSDDLLIDYLGVAVDVEIEGGNQNPANVILKVAGMKFAKVASLKDVRGLIESIGERQCPT